LVESVKGVMKQEKDVFGQLAEARSKYAGANTPSQKAGAATEVESSLARLLVVMENYPALRSVETVQSLMVELAGTENRVSVERKRFNDGVADYNVYIKRVPATWLASAFNFEVKNYFKADEPAKVAPKVDFK
ncbi:MAG: LemA family protein, partial [Candidatus Falkowbacteria bacterium]|nr:LemA family protein [Candidatus Falkowbacteria bacterium]